MPEAKPKKESNLIRVNNSMVHDIKGYDNRKAISNVGLRDKDGNEKFGTIYVGTKAVMADKKTEHLPDHQKKSYIGISRDNTYEFVMSTKGEDGKYVNTTEKITGADIVDQNHAYMANKRAGYAKAAEAEADKQTEAQAAGPETVMPEVKPKKESNLIRVNNSMVHDIKGYDNRKAISNVGLRDKDGNEKFGTIYVGTKAVMADKKTEHLPDHQKKSYIGISRDNTYEFVMSTKGEDGKYVNTTEKITGADIVDQNHAYMANKRAGYAKAAEAEADKQTEAQAAGPEMG